MPDQIDRLREAIESLTNRLRSNVGGVGGSAVVAGIAGAAVSGAIEGERINAAAKTIETTLAEAGRLINTALTDAIGNMQTSLAGISTRIEQAFGQSLVAVKEFTRLMHALSLSTFTAGTGSSATQVAAWQLAHKAMGEQNDTWDQFIKRDAGMRLEQRGAYRQSVDAARGQTIASPPPAKVPPKANIGGSIAAFGSYLYNDFKKTFPFDTVGKRMLEFASATTVVGLALKGLSGTIEGAQLNYAFNHVAYEIADMFRGPIRFLTVQLEGLARVMHFVDAPTTASNALGAATKMNDDTEQNETRSLGYSGHMAEAGSRNHDDRMYNMGLGALQRKSEMLGQDIEKDKQEHPFAVDVGWGGVGWHQDTHDIDLKKRYDSEIETAKQQHEFYKGKPAQNEKLGPVNISGGKEKPKDDHIQPMLSASFGNVADLQNKLQQLVSENPAQEKGLSLVEGCYNMLVKIFNGMNTGSRMEEIPDPSVVNGIKRGN